MNLRHKAFAMFAVAVLAGAALLLFSRMFRGSLFLFAALSVGSFLFLSAIFLGVLLRHVSHMRKLATAAQGIIEQNAFAERLSTNRTDELSALAACLNSALEQVEEAQTRCQLVTENIPQIFWIQDATTGVLEYVSPAFETIWGRPRSTLAENPSSWLELAHPEDREKAQRKKLEQRQGKATDFYYRIVSEDGETRWLWERSFPSFGPDGELRQISGLTEDITDFKRNEEALLEAYQELEQRVAQRTAELAEHGELIRLLVESTPGAIYGIDVEGNCTFCNPACLRLLGYSHAGELLGRKSHDILHHSHPDGTPYPQTECPVFASFHDGEDTHVVDEVFWKKDGTSMPVEYSSRQIRRHGKVFGAVVSFVDITERKQKEMELRHSQKLEAVGRLAAGIAHEINTPIQFVGDNTRFLQNAFVDGLKLVHKYQQLHESAVHGEISGELLNEVARAREELDWEFLEQEIPRAMEQMLEGLNRVATIVRGMKEFSHVDHSSEKAPSDLTRGLESTLIVARNELKYVADVETDFAPLPPVICHLGDLNQVFLNLLVNAAHAIQDVVKDTGRKGKITVRSRRDGDWVEVRIADTGTGIPKEARNRIFDPFFTTKKVGRGTGQGLALARAIVVEKHGGTLTFETETGKGTTFVIRLPIAGNPVREEALVS